MDVYLYAADFLCDKCGEALIRRFNPRRGKRRALLSHEISGDHNEFPQGPYSDGGGESDTPQHCMAGQHCKQALKLPGGIKVGCWLENPLTRHGVDYVRAAVEEGGYVATELWAKYYQEELCYERKNP